MKEKYIVDDSVINNIIEGQNKILELLNKKEINVQLKSSSLELLSVSQASEYLNISEVFLRKKIEKRELFVKRIGSSIRIDKRELNKLVK